MIASVLLILAVSVIITGLTVAGGAALWYLNHNEEEKNNDNEK